MVLEAPYKSDDRPRRIPDRDIEACARLLVERHGENAEHMIRGRADDLFADGDTEGYQMCRRIVMSIQALRSGHR